MSDGEDERSVPNVLKQYKDAVNKLQSGMNAEDAGREAKKASINISDQYMALDASTAAQDPTKGLVAAELERRKRARHLTLPTDDDEVKMLLRALGRPICLFGEDKGDRRERLRSLLVDLPEEAAHAILRKEEVEPEGPIRDTETWYHQGPNALYAARLFIAKYSLPRARLRLAEAREAKAALSGQERAVRLQETHKWVRAVTNYGSQIGDNRPLSYCEFSPDSSMIATSSWSGLCKTWKIPNCEPIRSLRGHNAASGCVRWHPKSCLSMGAESVNLASCGHDGSVLLWSLDSDEPLAELDGHAPHRVARLAFHPSGRFLATCCYDKSWRLFDLEVSEEVLFQEGHSRAVFDLSFHPDGSLALTGGMDAYGRVWDLRTGRCIMFLEGHQNHVITTAFSPNGYQMATGSADNSIKLWDLRMRRCTYTVPAHKNLVSKIKFNKMGGDFLISGSYDSKIKLWTNPGWQQLKELGGHDAKVMCVDSSPDGKWLASSSFDRTFKIWAPDFL